MERLKAAEDRVTGLVNDIAALAVEQERLRYSIEQDPSSQKPADATERFKWLEARRLELEAEINEAAAERDAIKAEFNKAIDARIAEREKAKEEDALFWYRRFILSLQIGHAGAVLAIMAGTLQADDPAPVAAAMVWPALFFGHGLLTAGVLPGLQALYRLSEQERAATAAPSAAKRAGA